MGRKNRAPKKMLTLEEQLAALGEYPLAAGPYDPDLDGTIQRRRISWHDSTRDLLGRIHARNAKRARIVDPGRDASGNFDVSPFAARGRKVETAPKTLDKELPKDSNFPRRAVDNRSIDRLRGKTITESEYRAAATLLWYWAVAEGATKMVAAYEPDAVRGSSSPDAGVIKRIDAASEYMAARRCIPYRALGVVTWVVINDGELSDWAAVRGFSSRHSRRLGAKRLSQGLRALAARWGT